MTAEDYVDVKLSAAGEDFARGPASSDAGQGTPCLRIAGGGYEYSFEPGKTVRLTITEFSARCEAMSYEGKRVFDIVPSGQSSRAAQAKRPAEAGAERS